MDERDVLATQFDAHRTREMVVRLTSRASLIAVSVHPGPHSYHAS